MTDLPKHIKQMFFKSMSAEISLMEFERWVYNTSELEQVLTDDDYLELISFNYKKEGARYELFRLLERLSNMGEYETVKLIHLLKAAKLRDTNLPGLLERFYDLYCNGYYFLNTLGMGFGLSMCVLPSPYKVEHWRELTETELVRLVTKIPSGLDYELDKVFQWLEEGKIVLTGEQDKYNHFKFIDHRSDEEKARISQYNF